MVPVPWQFVVLYLLTKAAIGFAVGAGISAFLYRSRLTPGIFLRNVFLGVAGYLGGNFLAAWAGQHSNIFNGRRLDYSSSGENFLLRNRIVEHELAASILMAIIPILALYLLSRPKKKARLSV